MIVPVWTTQVWFTGLLSLLIAQPRVFHVTNDVLSNPFLPGPHPLHPKLYLMACKLSGDTSLTAACLHKLPTLSSWRQGTQKQYNVYINKWSDFCTQRQVNSLPPTVTDILYFLHALYQQNLSYSTLNTT